MGDNYGYDGEELAISLAGVDGEVRPVSARKIVAKDGAASVEVYGPRAVPPLGFGMRKYPTQRMLPSGSLALTSALSSHEIIDPP